MTEKTTIQKIEEDLESIHNDITEEDLIILEAGKIISKETINGNVEKIKTKQNKIYVRKKKNYDIIVTASDEEMGSRITIYNEKGETINVSSKKIIDSINKIDKKIKEWKQ